MFDTIIVGAGVIGMMTAQLLSQQGQKICLIDKAGVGTESSWAGGGILSPLYPWRYTSAVNDLAQWSQQHYPDFLDKLIHDTRIDSQYHQSGLLIRNITDSIEQVQNWLKHYNPDAGFISDEESRNIASICRISDSDSLWLPNISQLRNPRFVKALRQSMELANVTIQEHCEVLTIDTINSRFSAVQTTHGTINASNLIIASGAWSTQLLTKFGQNAATVQIEPVRGQMMIIKTPVNTLNHIILDQEHYLIPRLDGRVLIGSTLEFVGFDKSTTSQAHDSLLSAAIKIAPALVDFPVEHHWAGLRPGSHDGIPYICQHPEVSGLFINSGHYRNGIVLGLGSAQLMVNIVLGQELIVDPSPYQCEPRH